MMSKNDITGDLIKTKVSDNAKFSEGFDRIWGKKSLVREALEVKCVEVMGREFTATQPAKENK